MTLSRVASESERKRTLGPQRATFVIRFSRERGSHAGWLAEVEFVQRGEKLVAGDPLAAIGHVAAWLDSLQREER